MADETEDTPKRKPAMVRITPLGLRGIGAHLHCSTGRCQMGAAILVPKDEAEALIEVGRAEKANEVQEDFIDKPREDAAI